MGVPLLLTWLRTQYKNCFFGQLPKTDDALHLYIDLNSILYQAAALILAERAASADSSAGIENAILRRVVKLLDDLLMQQLASAGQPVSLMYIAADGVSPLGKVAQQRSRRRSSRRPRDALWDLNNITSGTHFMSFRVSSLLRWYAASRVGRFGSDLAVIVSDSTVPGEGEQKIVDFIRHYRQYRLEEGTLKTFEYAVHVLCSNDTDVVVASLSLHIPRMYVLRYSPEAPAGPSSSFFSINEFRTHLYLRFGKPSPQAFENALHDVMFVLLLFGSDFLPALPWMDIGSGQLDDLIDFLCTDFVVRGKQLVDATSKGKVDCRSVAYFLKHVHSLKREDEPGVGEKRGRNDGGLQVYFGGRGEGDSKQSARMFGENKDALAFGGRKPASDETINAYWEGLQWLLHYQSGPCTNWQWYYPTTEVPTLDEISARCWASNIGSINSKPLSAYEQLILVLPSESRDLLPASMASHYDEAFGALLNEPFHRLNLSAIHGKVDAFLPHVTQQEQQRLERGKCYCVRLRGKGSTAADLEKKRRQEHSGSVSPAAPTVVAYVAQSLLVPPEGNADDDEPLPGLGDDDELVESAAPANGQHPSVEDGAGQPHQHTAVEDELRFFGLCWTNPQMLHRYSNLDKEQVDFAPDVLLPTGNPLEFWALPESYECTANESKIPNTEEDLLPVDPSLDNPLQVVEEGTEDSRGGKQQRVDELQSRVRDAYTSSKQ